jgi:hypothetical protein
MNRFQKLTAILVKIIDRLAMAASKSYW